MITGWGLRNKCEDKMKEMSAYSLFKQFLAPSIQSPGYVLPKTSPPPGPIRPWDDSAKWKKTVCVLTARFSVHDNCTAEFHHFWLAFIFHSSHHLNNIKAYYRGRGHLEWCVGAAGISTASQRLNLTSECLCWWAFWKISNEWQTLPLPGFSR